MQQAQQTPRPAGASGRAASRSGPVRLLVADDHQIVRQAVCKLLTMHRDFEVVGEASNGHEAVSMAETLQPDVVVMDVAMPGLNGIDATRHLSALPHGPRVVALSVHWDRRTVRDCMSAGAVGFVPKAASGEELAAAVRAASAGRSYVSPEIAALSPAPTDRNGAPRPGSQHPPLSPREREVLQLIAAGRATKEAAMDLRLSVKTVETHRRQIMQKLNLYSVADLTKYALREGLTQL
jgi:DNA-binding NarL/FixJ family response regulator